MYISVENFAQGWVLFSFRSYLLSWRRIKPKRLSWFLEMVIFEIPLILRQFALDIAKYDLSMKKLGLSKAKTLKKHAKVMYLKLTLVEIIDVFSWLVYKTTRPFTQKNIFFHWVYIAYISNFNKGEDGSNIVITCQKLKWTRTQFQPVCKKCILILTPLYSNWKTTKGDNQKTIEHGIIHYWSKTR